MIWLPHFQYSFYTSLLCVLLGFLAFPALRRHCGIGRYSALLVVSVFGAAVLGFGTTFFGSIALAGDRDTVMPAFAAVFFGPLSAIAGLFAFLAYAFMRSKAPSNASESGPPSAAAQRER
jgi:hypothetical protein